MIFGREVELKTIGRAITDARLGKSSVMVVRGEAGIGKTALLEAAAATAREEGMDVLAARGVESEAEVPFGGLLELLRPALGALDRIPAAQATALRSALDLGPTKEADRFVIGAATLNLLSAHSEKAPLLVLADDAQWLDDSSLTALLFAARRLLVDPVAVIFAARAGTAPALEAARLPALELKGVDVQAAAEIVARHARPRPMTDAVERLTKATGGNPLALVELAATGAPAGIDPGPLGSPPELATSVETEFRQRITNLPHDAQRALALAAAEDSGRLLDIGPAAEQLGLALTDLEPGERAGLASISYGALVWRHPLVRSA